MSFKNIRAPLLSPMLLQALCIISYPLVYSNWSYSPETPYLGQKRCCFSRVTLKFDGWPWKNIGHLFFTILSFVHHFKAMSGFNLELQSGNAQFGSKSAILCPVRPWNLTAASSFVHHFIAIGEFKLELQSGSARFGSKSTIFFSRVTFKLDRWPWKTIGRLFYDTSSFVHHFEPIGELKLELQSGNAQFGSKPTIFCVVWTSNLTDDLDKQ